VTADRETEQRAEHERGHEQNKGDEQGVP
jgi:hypothetical protein